jgi:hypothetical protein
MYKKNNPYKKIAEANCDVCGKPIMLDQYGNGDDCENCGWRQCEESADHPDWPGIRNIPSLSSARELYKTGKSPLIASFEDFLGAYEAYGELEFTYKGITYGIMWGDEEKKHLLFECAVYKELGRYTTIDDIKNKASINGVLLRDLWKDVTSTDFLQ